MYIHQKHLPVLKKGLKNLYKPNGGLITPQFLTTKNIKMENLTVKELRVLWLLTVKDPDATEQDSPKQKFHKVRLNGARVSNFQGFQAQGLFDV